MRKIKISPLTIIWIAYLIYANSSIFPHLILAISIHELGHIFLAKCLRIKIKSFEMSPLGAKIEIAHEISYKQEFLLAFGGPLFGLVGIALAVPFVKFSQNILIFIVISLCLNIFNLLPIPTFDGGRMLKCLIFSCFPLRPSQKIVSIISFLSAFCLWLFTVYLLIKMAFGISMLIFCSIFFAKCFVSNEKNGDFKSF